MSLSTVVKISQVTNLSDARYCAGMGVEMVGFMIDEDSESYVSSQKVNEIRSWLTGVKIVIESQNLDTESLLEAIEKYNPDYVQINNPYFISSLKAKTNKPIILSIEANQDADSIDIVMQKTASLVDYFLIESNTLTTFDRDWPDFLNLLSPHYPILLGFGITPQNARTLSSAGIALKGSTEIRPGFSEFGDLMDILEAIEED